MIIVTSRLSVTQAVKMYNNLPGNESREKAVFQ